MNALEFAARHRQVTRDGRTPPVSTTAHRNRFLTAQRSRRHRHWCWRETDALGAHLLETTVEHALFHLEFRDAIAQQAADAIGALEDMTLWPARRLLCGRRGRPDRNRPPPPLAGFGGGRLRQNPPSSKARSMMASSTALMVTGSSLTFSTQEASQGAGHSVPVNSGKLLVACRRSMASSQRRGRPDRSSPGSGCPAGSPDDRTECRSPCSARPAC
jgi:hypothetical protein